MNFLLLPNDIGGGGGHFFRLLALARLLRDAGHSVIFLIHQKKFAAILSRENIPYYRDRWVFPAILWQKVRGLAPRTNNRELEERAVFWEFPDLSYQWVRDGIWSYRELKRRLSILKKLIHGYSVQCVIGDGHILARIAGKEEGIPVIQLARMISFPETASMLWWKEDWEYRPPALERFFSLLRHPPESRQGSCGLFEGDKYLIPSFPQLEPYQGSTPHLYMGPLLRYPKPVLTDRTEGKQGQVYITFGSGAFRKNFQILLPLIRQIIGNAGQKVVISDPYGMIKKHIPPSENTVTRSWVDNEKILPVTSLVISHGGYGTLMDGIVHGVPQLIIPFHSEQEGNGRRLQQLGAGEIFFIHAERMGKISYQWNGDWFEMGVGIPSEMAFREFNEKMMQLMEKSDRVREITGKIRIKPEKEQLLEFLTGW